jgi:hypothetical protein
MKPAPAIELPIAQIRLDGGTQPRAALDFDAVYAYSEAMEIGAKFPPVVVFHDGENYWLADGFHRLKATFAAERDTIRCEVRQGTLEDAQWYSFSANQTNGLWRTNEDKQRAVKAALLHPKGAGLSDAQIARHVGVHHDTVRQWRAKLESSCAIRKMTVRTVTRRGKTYQQDITHVGRRQSPPPAAPQAPEPSPARAGQVPNGNAPGQGKLEALLRAVQTIVDCGIAARDLARQMASRADREHILRLMEKTSEFLELCATEARRPAGLCARSPYAGDAGDRPGVAGAEPPQPARQ